jgi:pyruvate dehydrogenase E2 component (dihydrolipoamide acetyltransferase)
MFEFKLPDIGEGVVEGEITKWLISEGESVAEDQPLVEVMTDKATVVIPSPVVGVVTQRIGGEGEIIDVGAVFIRIDDGGQDAGAASNATDVKNVDASVSAPATTAALNSVSTPTQPHTSGERVLAAPSTRALAREMQIEIQTVAGSGPGGRVTATDVQNAGAPFAIPTPAATSQSIVTPAAATPVAPKIAEPAAAPLPATAMTVQTPAAHQALPVATPAPAQTAPAFAGPMLEERVPFKGLRKTIAKRMAISKHTAAHFTFVEEVDMTELVELRERQKRKRTDGPNITFLPYIIKSVILALKKFPILNSMLDEASQELVLKGHYNIGIATATEAGLIVPVVKHADRLTIVQLAHELNRLSEATRNGTIRIDDLKDGTFTITSLGKLGGLFATPILNFPEVGIVGIHKITKRPVVDSGDIVIRDMMNMSLSFDHRIVDGHIGAAFAYEIIKYLENPDLLVLEMS